MSIAHRLSRALLIAVVLAVSLAWAGVATAAPQTPGLAALTSPLAQRAALTDLPGIPLTSPVEGMVNRDSLSSLAQVYSVNLQAGDCLAVRLNADAPQGIYMGLLPPGTLDITAEFVAGSEQLPYPQLLRYRAATSGQYYLVVFAMESAPRNTFLPYVAEYAITPSDDRSDIPGVPLSAGVPDTGAHDEFADWSDVYSAVLAPGEALHLRLDNRSSGSVAADTDLYLYGSSATSIYGSAAPVATSTEAPQEADEILYRSALGGTYYAATWAYGPDVDYTLESTVTPPTQVTCVSSATKIPYGGKVSISGALSENGGPLGGQYVLVQAYSAGFKTVGPARTATLGSWPIGGGTGAPYDLGTYKLSTYRATNTRFRTVYGGSFFGHSPSSSTYQDVFVSASLPAPRTPSAVYARRTFTAYGFIRPRHRAGTYPVQLRFERRDANGNWVRYRTVKARVSNYSSYSRYSASVSLPYRGTWRAVAYHPGDSITATGGNASTVSSERRFSVR